MTLKLSEKISDIIAAMVASWKFVILYTTIAICWVGLHIFGILQIDSSGFIFYSLFLSWWAGTQASIVLMASNRQDQKDRQKVDFGIKLDQRQLYDHKKAQTKILQIAERIDNLESILSIMEGEHAKRKKIRKKANKNKV